MTEVKSVLRELGVSAKYKGVNPTAIAVKLVIDEEERLHHVTDSIYGAVSAQCGIPWKTIERNIRTVVKRAWRCNASRLRAMAGYPLDDAPPASEFIEILANWIQRNGGIKD